MQEGFQIGIRDDFPYKKRERRNLEPTALNHTKWRIIPDSACDVKSLFCVDLLPGKRFLQKMLALERYKKGYLPPTCKDDLIHLYAEAEQVILLNQKTIFAFKRLLNAWKNKHLRIMNEEDPITLSKPVKPVRIVSSRYCFQYEAQTIALDLHKRLLHHDGQVADPLEPRNPLTNEFLTLQQMISVISQCKALGYSHWTLECFVKANYSIEDFLRSQRNPLRYNAIQKILANPFDLDGIDTLIDFIQVQYDFHNCIYPKAVFAWAMRVIPNDPLLSKWRGLCKEWYKFQIFDNIVINLDEPTEKLVKETDELRDRYLLSIKRTRIGD
jgi:hypothetical protein